MPYSLPCDFEEKNGENLEISGNIPWKGKTRLYPPWSVYKVVTRIPLYRRKGYPLYRELDMGVMKRTRWR